MKVLKFLGIALGILLVFFLLMGLFKPTVEYGHSVTVNKPIGEAWNVALDPNKHSEWLDGFVSETLISGEEGQVGSKYTVVVKPSPEEDAFEMTETIVSRKELDHIDLHFESDFGTFDQKMSFTGDSNSATIKTESAVGSTNYFMRTMFAAMEIFMGSFQKQEEKHINRLKEVIEANTTNYFATDSVSVE